MLTSLNPKDRKETKLSNLSFSFFPYLSIPLCRPRNVSSSPHRQDRGFDVARSVGGREDGVGGGVGSGKGGLRRRAQSLSSIARISNLSSRKKEVGVGRGTCRGGRVCIVAGGFHIQGDTATERLIWAFN